MVTCRRIVSCFVAALFLLSALSLSFRPVHVEQSAHLPISLLYLIIISYLRPFTSIATKFEPDSKSDTNADPSYDASTLSFHWEFQSPSNPNDLYFPGYYQLPSLLLVLFYLASVILSPVPITPPPLPPLLPTTLLLSQLQTSPAYYNHARSRVTWPYFGPS